MASAFLDDRGVVRVEGEDARSFLQGLVTCNMDGVSPEAAGFGALLSPQGEDDRPAFSPQAEGDDE